jgi:NAD+ kinase
MPGAVFKSIGLIGKYGDPGVADTLGALGQYLLGHNLEVWLDEATAGALPALELQVASRQQIGERCDLVIIVGGDGTLLNSARTLADSGVPVMGVNLGRLGFLVDVSPADMHARLDEILSGQYTEERRFLLRAQVWREGELLSESDALNDVVVHKWDVARMIDFDTYIDEQFVNTHRADGIIISTPTGSTAYALSGGGPIVHPSLEALVMVPICPHTLSDRPIMVSADVEVAVVVGGGSHARAQVTCDGQINVHLHPGDRVSIRRKAQRLRLIHPPGYDYYSILRAKLRWGGSAVPR